MEKIFQLQELLVKKEILNLEFNDKVVINLIDAEILNSFKNRITVITFKGCVFNNGILIQFNSESTNVEIDTFLNLDFDSCQLNRPTKNGNTVVSDLNCLSSNKRNEIKFHLDFRNCLIGNLNLLNSDFNHLNFRSCIFLDSLSIFNCKIKYITIQNSFGGFYIHYCAESNLNIEYENSNLKYSGESLKNSIQNLCNTKNITAIFYYKTFFNLLKVSSTNIKFRPAINENKTIRNIDNKSDELVYKIEESDFDNFDISLEVLFLDKLNLSLENKVNLNIERAVFKKIRLIGKSESIIKLEDVKSNSIFLKDFNTEKMEFFNIQSIGKDSKFLIVNSELINTWFNKVNLKSFDVVSIYRSTIEETRFTATDFPNEIESNKYRLMPTKGDFIFKKKLDVYDEPYENYRQLKSSLLKSDYVVKALEMHKKMYEAIKKSKNINTEDRIILTLNSISNKHATSIKQAFLLSIVLILSFHFLNMLALPNAPYKWGWVSMKSFSQSIFNTITFAIKHFEKVFIIANPVHRLDELSISQKISDLSLGNYAASYFSRLLIAWSYYQFIMAFRKFGKTH